MADSARRCRACAAPVVADNRFCPACGALYPAQAASAVEDDRLREVATEVATLVREKAELGAELERLSRQSGERELTPDERGQWERTYTRWRDVASEITLIVDRVYPRQEDDRRGHAAPPPAGERRSNEDRRDPFWRRVP